MKITFVTTNLDKLAEAKAILKGLDILHETIKLPEIQGSRRDIAHRKAEYALKVLNRPLFVEDTSLCFTALKELPGPYINDFIKKLGPKKLAMMLDSFKDKRAKAVCTIGLARPGKEIKIIEAADFGTIVAPRGRGFGWDPIFLQNGQKLTYGQLSKEAKNKGSFRRKALIQMKNYLLKTHEKQLI